MRESEVKVYSPQNTSGASLQKRSCKTKFSCADRADGGPKFIWTVVIYSLVQAETFPVPAQLKALASTLSEVGARGPHPPHFEGVNNIFSNQFGISGHVETLIIPGELYRAIVWSPQLLELFRRALFCCEALEMFYWIYLFQLERNSWLMCLRDY